MNRKQVLSAVRALTRGQDYVWDGKDKHDHLILFCKILLIFRVCSHHLFCRRRSNSLENTGVKLAFIKKDYYYSMT